MATISEAEFAGYLRRLDAEAFRAFVVDLYEARGYTVEREADGVLVVTPPRGAGRRRVALDSAGGRFRASCRWTRRVDADVLVTARTVSETQRHRADASRVVDASALYDRLGYGVDRATASDLSRRHLGVAFERDATTRATSVPVFDRLRSATPSAALRAELLVIPAVVLLIAAAIVSGAGPWAEPADRVDDSRSTVADGPQSESPTVAPDETPTPTPAGAESADVSAVPVVGLGASGVTDASALAREHARALNGSRYHLEIVSVEYIDGRESGRMTERIRIESPTVYRAEIRYRGDAFGLPSPAQNRSIYADGERRYVWSTTRETLVETRPVGPGGEYHRRAESLLRGFLSVENSTLGAASTPAWGNSAYLVRLNGTANPFVTEYRGEAIVLPPGVVTSLEVRYRASQSPNRTVHLSMRHGGFGLTSVERPSWYEDVPATFTATSTGTGSETDIETGTRSTNASGANATDTAGEASANRSNPVPTPSRSVVTPRR